MFDCAAKVMKLIFETICMELYFAICKQTNSLHSGCPSGADWSLSDCEGQPGGPAPPFHVPGPQT